MPQKSRCRAENSRQIGNRKTGGKCRQKSFENVYRSVAAAALFPSVLSIGRSRISAALFSDIHAVQSADESGRRNIADKIADDRKNHQTENFHASTQVHSLLFSEYKLNRRSGKFEIVSQLIFQVTGIRKMHQLSLFTLKRRAAVSPLPE